MSAERQVWSYVAHKDGKFAGAISGSLGDVDAKQAKQWKREVAEFCGKFLVDGFTVTPTYSREEYAALIKGMPIWERPKPAPEAMPLFPEIA